MCPSVLSNIHINDLAMIHHRDYRVAYWGTQGGGPGAGGIQVLDFALKLYFYRLWVKLYKLLLKRFCLRFLFITETCFSRAQIKINI